MKERNNAARLAAAETNPACAHKTPRQLPAPLPDSTARLHR